MARSRRKPLERLEHILILCKQEDLVMEGGDWVYNRSAVVKRRAMIREFVQTTPTNSGEILAYSARNRHTYTHEIFMRYDPNLVFTNFGWLYEERLKSPPRWFKILQVGETEETGRSAYHRIACRLWERGDDASVPENYGGNLEID